MKVSQKLIRLVVCVLSIVAVNQSHAQLLDYSPKLIDNPLYESWSQYRKGTRIKTETITKKGDKTISHLITSSTLKEENKDFLRIVSDLRVIVNEMEIDAGTRILEIKKKITQGPKIGPSRNVPDKNIKKTDGTDKMRVGSRRYVCNWEASDYRIRGAKASEKVWTCDKIPGTIVKQFAKSPDGITTESKVIEFVKK